MILGGKYSETLAAQTTASGILLATYNISLVGLNVGQGYVEIPLATPEKILPNIQRR